MRTRLSWLNPRGAAVAGAVLATLAVWGVAVHLYDVAVVVEAGPGRPRSIGAVEIGVGALAAGLGGWALLATLERVCAYAALIWTALALPTLILSLAGPLNATTVPATITLAGVHLAAGAILVPGLALSPGGARRAARRRGWPATVRR